MTPEIARFPRRRLLVGGAARALLAACTPSRPATSTPVSPHVSVTPASATGEPITVRLESYNYGTPGLGGKALQTMIDEFEALYLSITIQGKWMQSLVADGTHPPLDSNDAIAAFNAGNLGLFRNTTALLYAAEATAQGKYELRTADEPSFGGKTVHPVNSGSGLFVFATDPVRQQAVWKFLQFAASQRGFTIITSMIGYVPQRDDVVDDRRYLKPFVDKDPNLLTAFKRLPGLEPWINWSKARQGVQAESLFVEALHNVVYGQQDAQATMDATANRVSSLLADG